MRRVMVKMTNLSLRTTVVALSMTIIAFAPRTSSASDIAETRDCVIVPHRVIDVSSAAPGLLESVSIERSDLVTQGQVLARLESNAERAAVELADAWASIQSEIRLQSITRALDKRRMDRLGQLYSTKAVALDDKDQAETDVLLAEVRLRQAREKLWIRELDAKKAVALLERRTIRSPIAGVVVERFRSAGEYVENQAIARIVQLDPLQVETILPMHRFGSIQPGMRASVSAENDPSVVHTATVAVVDRVGDAASGTFGVRLSLPNPDRRIPAGLKCTLSFLPAQAAAPANADPLPAADEPDAKSVTNGSKLLPEPKRQKPDTPAAVPQRVANSATTVLGAVPTTSAFAADESVRNAIVTPPATTGVAHSAQTGTNNETSDAVLNPSSPKAVTTIASQKTDTMLAQSKASKVPVTLQTSDGADSICRAIGPLRNKQAANELLQRFDADGTEATAYEAETRITVGYIVVSSPPEAGKGARHVKRMRTAGVRDLLLMASGDFRGLISLGVYDYESAAARRRDTVAALGFKTEIRTRTRRESRWWVALRSKDRSVSVAPTTIALDTFPEGAGAEVLPCSSAEIVSEEHRADAASLPRV